jgi:hypothetical protein
VADDQEIKVSITAQVKGLLDGLATATSSVKAATSEMSSAFTGLSGMMSNLAAPIAAISGLLAGGALFKSSIDSTVQWAGEVKRLSMAMSTDMETASTWAVMLHTLGISADTMQGVMQRLQVRIMSGGKNFEAYGIAVKSANGAMKPSSEVLNEVIAKYNSLGSQSEKNAMLATMFGRAWMTVAPIMRATAERMEEAKKEAQELHLEVGPDGVAKTRAYQEAMRKLGLIGMSFKNIIGNELLPVLTSLAQWLGKTGPSMAEGCGISVKALASIFMGLWGTVKIAVTGIEGALWALWDVLSTVVKTIYQAATGDFKGAWSTIKEGFSDVATHVSATASVIKDDYANAANFIKGQWADAKIPAAEPDMPGMPGPNLGKQKKTKTKDPSSDQMEAFRQELEAKKDEEQNWFTWSAEKEKAFWQEKAKTAGLGAKAVAEITTEIHKLDRKEAEDAEREKEKDSERSIQAAREGSVTRVAPANAETERVKSIYGEQSEQYKTATAKVGAAARAHSDAMLEAAEKAASEQAKKTEDAASESVRLVQEGAEQELHGVESLVSQGLITREAAYQQKKSILAREQADVMATYEQERSSLSVPLAASQVKLASMSPDDSQYEKVAQGIQRIKDALDKVTKSETEFGARMNGSLQQIDNDTKTSQTTWAQYFQKMNVNVQQTSSSLRTSFQQSLTQINTGTANAFSQMIVYGRSFGQSMREVVGQILSSFLSMLTEIGLQWVETHLLMALTGKSTQTTTAVSEVMSNAAVAASAAFASTAAIPITGPALAPAVAAAAYTSVMGYAGLAAFDNGGIVQSTGLSLVHQSEGVLTAPTTKMLQRVNSAINGGGLAAASGTAGVTQHISFNGAIDAKSFFNKNQGAILSVLSDAAKNRRI